MTAYLLASIALFLVWLFLFLLSSSTRKEQILLSIVGLVMTPAAYLLGLPLVGTADSQAVLQGNLEHYLFAFSFFGIAAVAYQALLGKRVQRLRGNRFRVDNTVLHWGTILIILLGLWIFSSLVLMAVFAVSVTTAFATGAVFIGLYMIADRHDLLANALLSGAFMAMLVFALERIFLSQAPVGPELLAIPTTARFLGISIAEILWAAVAGFAIGPLYEYVRGQRLVK